jgi:hypothetical protein
VPVDPVGEAQWILAGKRQALLIHRAASLRWKLVGILFSSLEDTCEGGNV